MQFKLDFFIFLPLIKQKIKNKKNNVVIFGIYIFAAVINQIKFFMKKLMYLLIAALMVTFTACGGAEEAATEETVAEEVVVEETPE